MKIRKSTVEKLTITQIPNMDALSVIVENFGSGQGEITITSFGESWNNYWSHMGDDEKMADFFIKASDEYLAHKLKSGIKKTVMSDDESALETHLKRRIACLRRACDIEREEARDLWELAGQTDYGSHDNLRSILGDEWYLDLPQVPNYKYEHLCLVIGAVKEALKQQRETK